MTLDGDRVHAPERLGNEGECQDTGALGKEIPVVCKIIRYVAASEIPGATPGKAGGNIAVVVDDLGHEVLMTAAQYRTQEFATIRALELWREVRFLQPTEIHPDDFRTLYPELADLTNMEIRKRLERVAGVARTRPGVGFRARPVTSG